MDGLRRAHGFRFWAEGASGVEMGDEARAGDYELRAELPSAASQIRLLRNGSEIATAHTTRES